MDELLTFGLAYLAYVLLGLDVALRAWRRPLRAVTAAVALVALTHVLLVWGLRFGWSAEAALARGPAGLLVFHTALALLVAAALVGEPSSGWLVLFAFPVVTFGALGAAFRYDYVRGYRLPLLGAFSAALVLVAFGITRYGWRRR